MSLYDEYLNLEDLNKNYYRQFTYDMPLFIGVDSNRNMQFIQQCMVKCIRHMALNYELYRELMPIDGRAKEILNICNKYPYRPGTYRTDFIITPDNQIKLIEITCRFALNGFIRSGFVNAWAEQFAAEHSLQTQHRYPSFFDDLKIYFGNNSRIILLKNDAFNEGKYAKALFSNSGYEVNVLELDQLVDNNDLLKSSVCITQMRHDELFTLPDATIHAMMQGCLLNDFRTVIIPHDKRFFALLYNDTFRTDALGQDLASQFKQYLTPTYTPHTHPDLWKSLPEDEKNVWIIKPTVLGMGLGIFTNHSISRNEWKAALEQCDVNDTVFQPYLEQRRLDGTINTEIRTMDYVAGTLLFFQDNFYGPGMFRASTHPVTNQGDDRKIATAVLSTQANQLPRNLQNSLLFV